MIVAERLGLQGTDHHGFISGDPARGYRERAQLSNFELRTSVDVVLEDPSRNHYSVYDPFVEEILENQVQAYT